MELATSLLAADAVSSRPKGPTTATAGAHAGFAAAMRQLDADGDTAGTPDTPGNTGGNAAPRDGKALPLSLGAMADKATTETPQVILPEDGTPPIAPSKPTSPTATLDTKDMPLQGAQAKGQADPAVASLPHGPAYADTMATLPPAASAAPATGDRKDADREDGEAAAGESSGAMRVAESIKDNAQANTTETVVGSVDATRIQEPDRAEPAATQAPPVPVVPGSTMTAQHDGASPLPSAAGSLPFATDRSVASTTTVQAMTTAPGNTAKPNTTAVKPDTALMDTVDTGKVRSDPGKAFSAVITPASDTLGGTGGMAGPNSNTAASDIGALPQTPQSAAPTHAPTPPHAMLAAALLANGAPPSGNIAPGYTPAFMGSPAWLDAMDTQVSWMQDKGIVDAELKLHPAELGALEISINVQDDKAVVRMVAGTAQARDLLEASLPRLRDMFAANGMQLAHGSVAQGDSQRGQQAPTPQRAPLPDQPATAQPAPRSATTRALSLHSIDHYV